MSHILGIDLGTTCLKAGVFDTSGGLHGLGRCRVCPTDTGGGRYEWSVPEFWATLRTAVSEAICGAGITPAGVGAVACASQANTFILLHADDGEPLSPLVLWPDTRGGLPRPVRALWERPSFLNETGIGVPPRPEHAVAKWAWWQEQRPVEFSKARILTLPDYVAWSLTGRAVVDAGTASMLGLLDQDAIAWWSEALQGLQLDPSRLAHPQRPGEVIGPITPRGADLSGLAAGTLLVTGGLDHQLAAIGAAVVPGPGELSVSLGTVLAAVSRDAMRQPRPGICCLPGRTRSETFHLAFDGRGGRLLERYRAQAAPDLSVGELDALAAAAPADAGGIELTWPPVVASSPKLEFTERPAGHGHAVRAILNASGAALRELVERLMPGSRPRRVVVTGGGAGSALWRSVLSGHVGCPVVAACCLEAAARGAALLARDQAIQDPPKPPAGRDGCKDSG